MLYLINQRLPDFEDLYAYEILSDTYCFESISKAIEDQKDEEGHLLSALDNDTANIVSQLSGLNVPYIGDFEELDSKTPCDVAVSLEDNLELGDEIISIVVHRSSEGTNFCSYYKYVKWE